MSGAMTPTIGFDEIPFDWRVPATLMEIRPDRRNQGLVPYPQRTLIMAPRLASGTGPTLTPVRITRPEQGRLLGGRGSVAQQMVEAFILNNRTSELWLMLVDDATGPSMTGALTFTGSATEAGQVAVNIAGTRFAVPASTGDTAAQIATRVRDAIAARPDLPVTAAVTGGVVTLTCRHASGLGFWVRYDVARAPDGPLPAGLFCAVSGMSGSAAEVDFFPGWNAIAAQWFTDIVTPNLGSAFALAVAQTEARWSAMSRLDTHLWNALVVSFSALSTGGNTQNGRFVTVFGISNVLTPQWSIAAALAGVSAFHFTNDPARQLRGLPLLGVDAPAPASRFTDTERDLLLRDGISTYNVTDDGQVLIERIISQYQRTSLGVEDTAWLDVTRSKTLSRIRYDWTQYMNAAWPRAKLADDTSPAAEFDQQIATPRRLHASWASRLSLYERMGWVEDASGLAQQAVFVRDASDRNRVNARQPVRILGNLMTLAGVLEFAV